ncbi:lysophospholipid acyltransferase family protein [Maridesulfovibrio hydrothermalis]|uniref:Putative hemolysin n=1 Tax=Maridesulfovibrio hydrothermalis AM13 = DSM 14728 TaxID=1121451 RepID=L0RGI5_9BACT|nr:GNAT family N-acyltransferase [Maridesulfovibrio hydrothermalis]CCO25342.1 putative hemolysin [Maridesulfovibrio hydrothermalis AM13 = DSM 14728]
MTQERCSELFRLKSPFEDPLRGTLFSVFEKPLSSILCLSKLNSLYNIAQDESVWDEQVDFVEKALKLLGINSETDKNELLRIPRSGPSVVVANHPFGVVEGLVLLRVLKAVRPDVKIMANFMLGIVPEMSEYLISVDPFGRKDSCAGNISGLKEAVKWVKGGGMLAVFPAGEVASLKIKDRKVEDPDWSPTVAGIIKKTGASATPVFFNGRNSIFFQMMGMVHPGLRTVLLPRENLKKTAGPVELVVGNTISGDRLSAFKTRRELIEYLRFRTDVLRSRFKKKKVGVPVFKKKSNPLCAKVGQERIIAEFDSLGSDNILAENNEFTVYEVHSTRSPFILREIGRLREKTFREVGEGTGKAVDVDRFDNTFIHLVLWSRKNQEIAGAYRFARTDEVIRRFGLNGVYSHSFFRFDKEFFNTITPALELGRSFICSKYQKNFASLLMLWKGIAGYLAKNHKYRYLFGCVSISGDYKKISRELIADSLMTHSGRADLAEMISPVKPLKYKKLKYWKEMLSDSAFSDPEDLEKVVQDIEGGIGIPVLLRHYLKLGGKLAGFNVDPDFGNSLDGLIVVDLTRTSERSLFKFMGKERGAEYLEYHRNLNERAVKRCGGGDEKIAV